MTCIMLVDDDEQVTSALIRIMRKKHKDWTFHAFNDPTEALSALKTGDYQVIVSDYCMNPINGVVFLIDSKVFQRDAIRIILSAQSQLQCAIDAINNADIFRYIEKPVKASLLIDAIEEGLQLRAVTLENEELACLVRRQRKELQRTKKFIDDYIGTNTQIKLSSLTDKDKN